MQVRERVYDKNDPAAAWILSCTGGILVLGMKE
jgi:hypothetical protein